MPEPWPTIDADAFARWLDARLRTPLTVRTSRTILVLRNGLIGFFVLFALLVGASRGLSLMSIGLALMMLALAGVMFALFRNARRRAIVRLDHDGLQRGDGRRFAWRDLVGVENQLALSRRHVHEVLWRITLHFPGDEAWILPAQTANLDEVLQLLEGMPLTRRQTPV